MRSEGAAPRWHVRPGQGFVLTAWMAILWSGCLIDFDKYQPAIDAGPRNDGGPSGADADRADGDASTSPVDGRVPDGAAPADGATDGGSVPACTQVAAGARHSCALVPGVGVQCWGDGTRGQLGDGRGLSRPSPSTVVEGLEREGRGEVALWAGGDVTCSIAASGTLSCWGAGDQGQIPGATADQVAAQPVTELSGVREVALGIAHGCAAFAGARVACWGHNAGGVTLGIGMPEGTYGVTEVVGPTDAIAIASKSLHVCAIERTGTVWCWGENSGTQLGDGTASAQDRPVRASQVTDTVDDLVTGASFTCGLSEDVAGNVVRCWGSSLFGQLGNGTVGTVSPTPVAVDMGLDDPVQLVAGTTHACALERDGEVRCWGNREFGQVGDGVFCPPGNDCHAPRPQDTGLSGVTHLAAGSDHTCAVVNCDSVVCWGRNDAGQLGDRTTDPRATPVPVVGL